MKPKIRLYDPPHMSDYPRYVEVARKKKDHTNLWIFIIIADIILIQLVPPIVLICAQLRHQRELENSLLYKDKSQHEQEETKSIHQKTYHGYHR